MSCPRSRCSHPASAHEPEPIFDDEDGQEGSYPEAASECGDCRACFDELQARVAADREARPAQYRPIE